MKKIVMIGMIAALFFGMHTKTADQSHSQVDGELYVATKAGMFKTTVNSLNKGAKVNTKWHNGLSALYVASYERRSEIVELLIMHGADLNIQCDGGTTPLMAAILKEYTDQPLLPTIALLLQHRADLDIKDDTGETALSIARKYSDTDVVKLLLEHKAQA